MYIFPCVLPTYLPTYLSISLSTMIGKSGKIQFLCGWVFLYGIT